MAMYKYPPLLATCRQYQDATVEDDVEDKDPMSDMM
jgi:hypothetical protein